MKIFAVTTRGLEAVSAKEMSALPGMQVRQVAYRRVMAEYDGPRAALASLATIDDVFLDVAHWSGIGRQRNALQLLKAAASGLDITAGSVGLPRLRPGATRPVFSVTANFVGKRNYNTAEIKQAIAAGIVARYGWIYQDEDTSWGVNLRIFLEHEQALAGIRLTEKPLHKRDYKQVHISGSLKPSIAAAMLVLVEASSGQQVLDPSCGAGTILIEAAARGSLAYGGDKDWFALKATAANAAAAGFRVSLQQWDAQALPLASRSMARVVANLPWGRQVAVNESLAGFYRQACREIQRVLAPDGRLALLTSLPNLVDFENLVEAERLEISLYGQRPTILVFARNS